MAAVALKNDPGRKHELLREIGVIVEELGYEYVHAAMVTEFGRVVIRVFIDSLGGINVADCERVSKAVNRFLDGRDERELDGRYYLEVSSPGLERPLFSLKDYVRFQGRQARVRTLEPIDGRKTHVGEITRAEGEQVSLLAETGEIQIPLAKIARATLVYEGLKPQEPKNKRLAGGRKKHEEEL